MEFGAAGAEITIELGKFVFESQVPSQFRIVNPTFGSTFNPTYSHIDYINRDIADRSSVSDFGEMDWSKKDVFGPTAALKQSVLTFFTVCAKVCATASYRTHEHSARNPPRNTDL